VQRAHKLSLQATKRAQQRDRQKVQNRRKEEREGERYMKEFHIRESEMHISQAPEWSWCYFPSKKENMFVLPSPYHPASSSLPPPSF